MVADKRAEWNTQQGRTLTEAEAVVQRKRWQDEANAAAYNARADVREWLCKVLGA